MPTILATAPTLPPSVQRRRRPVGIGPRLPTERPPRDQIPTNAGHVDAAEVASFQVGRIRTFLNDGDLRVGPRAQPTRRFENCSYPRGADIVTVLASGLTPSGG